MESSPWDVNVDAEYQDLTRKHLDALYARDPIVNDDGDFTFAIVGDPQGTPADFKAAIDEINRHDNVNFILILGDMTDYGLLHEYEWAAQVIVESSVPVLTVIGNHDAISHGKDIYTDMFGPLDYVIEYAGFRFAMWNNNLYEFGVTNFEWLKNNLDENTIVASHVPPVQDMHNAEQLDEWLAINRDKQILGSLHGHRGGKNSFYWETDETPYYVVARNRGERFAIVTIDSEREINILECTGKCPEEVE